MPFGRIVVYSNGNDGWITTPQGTNAFPAETLATVRGVLFRQPSSLMLSDRDPSRSVKAVDTDAVEVSSADGESVRIEFDPTTGLPLRQTYWIAAGGSALCALKHSPTGVMSTVYRSHSKRCNSRMGRRCSNSSCLSTRSIPG